MKPLKYIVLVLQLSRLAMSWPNFYFYPLTNSSEYKLSKTESVRGKGFNYNYPTLFIVHGFGSSGLEPRFQQMKDAFRNRTKTNIIIVDWKEGARSANNFLIKAAFYLTAIINLRNVGKDISIFIKTNMIDPASVTCIGHSLGRPISDNNKK